MLESAYGSGPVYQQPAMDDYGYGDPGYSDPSYEGPKTPYGNPAFPADHGRTAAGTPGHRGTSGEPATGRRAAFPDTRSPRSVIPPRQLIRDPATRHPATRPLAASPSRSRRRPAAAMRSGRSPGPRRPCPTGRTAAPRAGGHRGVVRPGESAAYPEQWYDNPRLDDRVLGDSNQSRSADPRLVGMTYGELRYDDPEPGESGYDEPLDDESWFKELRRSAPAYPQSPGGPQGPGSGPQRRAEPSGPAFGQQAGFPQAPDRASGYGQPRRDGSGPQAPKSPQGPQMSAGRPQQGPAAPGAGFLSAPVGLLTPPGGTRVDALRDGGTRPAAPAASPRRTQPAPGGTTEPPAGGDPDPDHPRVPAEREPPGNRARCGRATAWTARRSRPPGRPSPRPATSTRSRTSGGTTRTRNTPACSGTGKPSSSARTPSRPRPSGGPAAVAAAATTTVSGSVSAAWW